ncbi:MAG: hypothetical protein U1C74_23915 [Phenylobacterium sp.]|nr:hypothetical protein [Phenylobacterium sp.]
MLSAYAQQILTNSGPAIMSKGEREKLLSRLPNYIEALRAADLVVTVQHVELVLKIVEEATPVGDGYQKAGHLGTSNWY